MLIWQAVEEQARRRPDGVAIADGERSITYRQLAERVARLSAGLAGTGLSAGDRVAVLLPNSLELVTTMMAASAAGLIVVPLPPAFPAAYLARILERTVPTALVASAELRGRVPSPASASVPMSILVGGTAPGALAYEELIARTAETGRPGPEDSGSDPICLLADTSGSSGLVKIVAHSQSRLVERADRFVETMALGAGDETVTGLHLGRPMSFVCALLAMLRVGGKVTLVGKPDPGPFWTAYAERRPTYVLDGTDRTRRAFDHPAAERADHSRLRFWIAGGDAASPVLRERVARWTGRQLLEMYGSTEAGALAINPPGGPIKVGSVGRPMPGVEMRLADALGRTVGSGPVSGPAPRGGRSARPPAPRE